MYSAPSVWPHANSSYLNAVQAIYIPPGSRFGKLTVIEKAPNVGKNRSFVCKCDCGTVKIVQARYLRNQTTQSCGCLKLRLGLEKSSHPLYQIWKRMHATTTNRNHSGYQNAGELGVRVCEAWSSFDKFLEDMAPRPKNTMLVRVDKLKDYTPENCRWLTAMQRRALHGGHNDGASTGL
jgi:hypothetical protein